MFTLFYDRQTRSKIQTLRPFEKLRRSGQPEVLTLIKGYATRPAGTKVQLPVSESE
jgi:hypothetical protein